MSNLQQAIETIHGNGFVRYVRVMAKDGSGAWIMEARDVNPQTMKLDEGPEPSEEWLRLRRATRDAVNDQRDRRIEELTAERDKAVGLLRDIVELLEERWIRNAT